MIHGLGLFDEFGIELSPFVALHEGLAIIHDIFERGLFESEYLDGAKIRIFELLNVVEFLLDRLLFLSGKGLSHCLGVQLEFTCIIIRQN